MISVKNLTKQFGLIHALDDISFEVPRGEILGFLGPNGAGKTTTMRILTGLIQPTKGEIEVAGINLADDSFTARKKIGYLPESVPLYRDLRVEEYLYFVASLKGLPRSERREHIDGIIKKCGLSQVKERIIGKLSKGYRQRVGLAQALTGDPEVLILDEPTEGLDPKQIIEIRQLIRELGGSHTVILSTHILPEVSMICERVIILNKGKLIAVDTPENLNQSLQTGTSLVITAAGPPDQLNGIIQQVPGVNKIHRLQESRSKDISTFRIETDSSSDIRPGLARAVVNSGMDLLELKSGGMSLEEIFVQLVTDEEVE